MSRFAYIVYCLIVIAVSTLINLSMTDEGGRSSRGWGSGGYSGGGSSYSGGHK
ncbi:MULTISPECIES: hypothetical protein [Jeongeupia]|uniref:Glycine-rich protein n=2 Tax=Jeongeupia TaxID=885864 RepID=A0ABS2BPC8_9NEIS|nr:MULTISPECIES: hypothetical protein [Jeongeupia]MBM3117453.1 hypothetical protein [Jeongeupia naejangsanensis]GHD67659.1 hypothetical protein GCM10007350_31660 [Jeongeupia chitinilytica]